MNEAERKRLAQIEARLNAATPGEWQTDLVENVVYTRIDGEDYTVCMADSGADWKDGANMSNDLWFIADAPEDIRWLAALVKRLADGV